MIDTNALRSRIAEKGFSQARVAESMGITPKTLLRGRRFEKRFFNLYADILLFNIINLFTVSATGLHNVKKF